MLQSRKIHLEQALSAQGKLIYWVTKTINTTTPKIDDRLSEIMVQDLISRGFEVTIVLSKRKV